MKEENVPVSEIVEEKTKSVWNPQHEEYIPKIQEFLGDSFGLVTSEKGKNLYSNGDDIGLYFMQAKLRRNSLNKECAFTIKQSQRKKLEKFDKRFFAFGVNSPGTIVVISENNLFKSIENLGQYDSKNKEFRWVIHFIHNAVFPYVKENNFSFKEFII